MKKNNLKTAIKILALLLTTQMVSGCSRSIIKNTKQYKQNLVTTNLLLSKSEAQLAKKADTHFVSTSANRYIVKSDQLISLNVSNNGYTRLFIDDERITDVFVYPQEALQVRIHNQGYLIIVPNLSTDTENDSSDVRVYLTLTGEKGTTQDVSLRFTGKNPEPVSFVKLDSGNNLK